MTEKTIACGTSFCGLIDSSLTVVIKSNPMYPKNRMVEASITPANPFSSFKKGSKFFQLKLRNDIAMMKTSIMSFAPVIILLKFPAEDEPLVLIQVQNIRKSTDKGEVLTPLATSNSFNHLGTITPNYATNNMA